MSRRFKPAPERTDNRYNDGLPLKQDVGLYYRQSSEGSIGNIYTTIQTVDMFDSLLNMGWREDQIRLKDVDAGVSGTLAIDQREGMRELFGWIVNGEIGAVAAQDEDRFFRDETMIQVDIFIDACKTANVKVITSTFIYDFSHPMLGAFHARQFRWKCEIGAEYIKGQIIGKLGGARRHLMRTGRWSGAPLPVGYMVDVRNEINGERNPDHRRIKPFEPYAEIVREYFRIFVSYNGSISKTARHIMNSGLRFPDPANCTPPEGYKVNYRKLRENQGGYLTHLSIARLLTNPVYIGHWMFEGAVVKWNNHECIVDEALFWQAFNLLSPMALDGSPNPDYRPLKQHARPSLEESRSAERPLCSGLIFDCTDEARLQVGTRYTKDGYYFYQVHPINRYTGETVKSWTRRADYVDEAILYHLLHRLETTFKKEEWDQSADELMNEPKGNVELLIKQRKHLEAVMNNLLASLETLSKPNMILDVEQRYEQRQIEHQRLTIEIEKAQAREVTKQQIELVRSQFTEIAATWEGKTSEDKRGLMRLLINSISIVQYSERGETAMLIEWIDNETELMVLPYSGGNKGKGKRWTYAEVMEVRILLAEGKDRYQIREALPHRSRNSVNDLVRREILSIALCSDTSSDRSCAAASNRCFRRGAFPPRS